MNPRSLVFRCPKSPSGGCILGETKVAGSVPRNARLDTPEPSVYSEHSFSTRATCPGDVHAPSL